MYNVKCNFASTFCAELSDSRLAARSKGRGEFQVSNFLRQNSTLPLDVEHDLAVKVCSPDNLLRLEAPLETDRLAASIVSVVLFLVGCAALLLGGRAGC